MKIGENTILVGWGRLAQGKNGRSVKMDSKGSAFDSEAGNFCAQ